MSREIANSIRIGAARQSGLAIVELTIVLPILLFLMLAVAEFGRALYYYNTLEKAARDGLRYVADHARNNAGVINAATLSAQTTVGCNLAESASPSGGEALLPGLDCPPDSAFSLSGDDVIITLSYEYSPIFLPLPTFGLGDGDIDMAITMTSTQTMTAL